MKKLAYCLLLIAAVLLFNCEEVEDITGDANMKVINLSTYTIKIYFDDAYIGSVDEEDNKTWAVPSGSHVIEGKCSFSENYKGTHAFHAGQTTIITLDIDNKYSSSIKFIDLESQVPLKDQF